jgi:hypothetical protein
MKEVDDNHTDPDLLLSSADDNEPDDSEPGDSEPGNGKSGNGESDDGESDDSESDDSISFDEGLRQGLHPEEVNVFMFQRP